MSKEPNEKEKAILREQNVKWLKGQYDKKHAPVGSKIHALVEKRDYKALLEYFEPDSDAYKVVADLLEAKEQAEVASKPAVSVK